ncbi:MAG TPA: two-component regulator propeller domain-containing protein [Bacteroidales bacterium]|nr:two-component regulator propeller domain-containing protein [Bacteroidales bacterium]
MSFIRAFKCRVPASAWLLLFYMAAPVVPTSAQKYFFDNYGIKQGLSEQKVYVLLQDKRDYIWLGTANGVSRFDGKRFENFTSADNLAPGGVKTIMQDSLGYIWFGHLNGGISRYDGRRFEKITFDSLELTGDITGIAQISDYLWFTSSTGGAVVAEFPINDPLKVKVTQFRGKDGLSDQIFGSAVVQDTSFICISDAGLRRYNREQNKFEIFRMPHMTTYFSTICLMEDTGKNIWFGTYNGGLYKYNMSKSRMQFIDLPRFGIASNSITCITEDRKGRVWIGTWDGGIAVIDDTIPRKFDATNGLKASRIYDIIEDVEGNILIADQNNGLTIFKGDALITINSEEILPDPVVNAVYQDKSGNMWFGTNTCISRYAPGTSGKPVIYKGNPDYYLNYINFFREDKEGNLWIGTNDAGVVKYDMKKQKFEQQPGINSKFPNGDRVTAMEIDKNNNLWIGTVDGLIAGTIGEDNFVRRISIDSITITTKPVTALYCDPSGVIWIGTEPSGSRPTLFRFLPSTGRFMKVPAVNGIRPVSMAMDPKGILWIGTNEGLKAFRNDSIIATVTREDGLLSDIINLVAAGDDGSIFIGTNNGLNRFFPESKRIFSYTQRNGFTGIETRPNAFYRSRSGDLWFGTSNGAIQMKTAGMSTEELEPLTHIMDMQVNYEMREMTPGMKLRFNERTILFDYYSICVTNPDVVRYKVMLEGADNDWRPVTEETRTIYSGLRPGKYTFKVLASNSQGVWNREPVSFSFVIKPPFYMTWWFILLSAVVIAFVVFIYIKAREKKLVREKAILEDKVRERTAEVVQKSMEIEEKNRDITASIRYAERIQRAMLPRENMFDETFVLFMPKDIVSGDFYWMYGNGEYEYIAVCDCTGHGVPGAFMSIIGHNSLNKVVREYGITTPSAILDNLNTEVLKALRQRNEETINDGMDMALIAFNRNTYSIDFSGAYNPLYLVRNGEVTVYKGDRFPIGMAAISEKKSFTNQRIEVQAGDMLYMCSDGYADQFGSPEMKKFKSGNIRKLLSEIYHLPMQDQRCRLEAELLNWKGDLPQVDDILFVGTRIPGRN